MPKKTMHRKTMHRKTKHRKTNKRKTNNHKINKRKTNKRRLITRLKRDKQFTKKIKNIKNKYGGNDSSNSEYWSELYDKPMDLIKKKNFNIKEIDNISKEIETIQNNNKKMNKKKKENKLLELTNKIEELKNQIKSYDAEKSKIVIEIRDRLFNTGIENSGNSRLYIDYCQDSDIFICRSHFKSYVEGIIKIILQEDDKETRQKLIKDFDAYLSAVYLYITQYIQTDSFNLYDEYGIRNGEFKVIVKDNMQDKMQDKMQDNTEDKMQDNMQDNKNGYMTVGEEGEGDDGYLQIGEEGE
jgi:hypothetical protein